MIPRINLKNVNEQIDLPVSIKLDGGILKLLSWLRILPGKRYVAEAVWSTESSENKVLAKLYLGGKSKNKMTVELDGCQRLTRASLPAAKVVANGAAELSAWLLLEWLPDAKTLAQVLALEVDSISFAGDGDLAESQLEIVLPPLQKSVEILRQMHDRSLQQKDLHLDNFLYVDGKIFIIDAAEVQSASDGSRDRNLSMLLAQLPHCWWSAVLQNYFSAADEPLNEQRQQAIKQVARDHRLWRAKDICNKSQRNCSLFSAGKSFYRWHALWRSQAMNLMPLLDNIETEMAAGQMLKNGGSSTVVRIQWRGQDLVVKRYNVKGVWHFLRRCLRSSRALHSWQQGHLWRVLELPTPKPLAVIEKRWGPLRLGGYLVTEYTSGKDIISGFDEANEGQLLGCISQLQVLLKRMASYQLSHGDLKGSNILSAEQGQENSLSFIDLDAACQHISKAVWRKNFIKDLARLQRNWSKESQVICHIKCALSELHSSLNLDGFSRAVKESIGKIDFEKATIKNRACK